MTDVAAPIAQPWDELQITADALEILRLDDTDPDAERVAMATTVAMGLADQLLDASAPFAVIPDPCHYGAVLLTVEMYRRKDAPFGVLGAWSADDIAVRITSDVWRSVRGLFLPYKSRFGVA